MLLVGSRAVAAQIISPYLRNMPSVEAITGLIRGRDDLDDLARKRAALTLFGDFVSEFANHPSRGAWGVEEERRMFAQYDDAMISAAKSAYAKLDPSGAGQFDSTSARNKWNELAEAYTVNDGFAHQMLDPFLNPQASARFFAGRRKEAAERARVDARAVAVAAKERRERMGNRSPQQFASDSAITARVDWVFSGNGPIVSTIAALFVGLILLIISHFSKAKPSRSSDDGASNRAMLLPPEVPVDIAGAVKTLTRFDPARVPFTVEGRSSIAVMSEQRYDVSFGVSEQSIKGGLPSNVRVVSSASAAQSETAALTSNAANAVPYFLRRWAEGVQSPSTQLRASDCFESVSTIGYTVSCDDCDGRGRHTCGNCGGRGDVQCNHCNGRGVRTCGRCNGSATMSCYSCNGSGGRMNYQNGQNVRELCNICRGAGTQQCSTCNGRRTVNCTSCHSGRMDCAPCGRSGQVNCRSCAATGKISHLADLTCSVSEALSMHANTPGREISSTIAALPSLNTLCTLAPVHEYDRQISGRSIVRKFDAACVVTNLTVTLPSTRLTVLGYGDRLRVFNFKNLIATLLMPDVDTLERASAGSVAKGVAINTTIAAALHQFFLSPAHGEIARSLDSGTSRGASTLGALVRAATMDGHFVDRAAAAIHDALPRFYRSLSNRALIGVAIAATLAMSGRWIVGTHSITLAEWAMIAVAGGAFVGNLVQRRSLNSLRQHVSPEVAGTLVQALDATKLLRRERRSGVLIAMACAIVVAWL